MSAAGAALRAARVFVRMGGASANVTDREVEAQDTFESKLTIVSESIEIALVEALKDVAPRHQLAQLVALAKDRKPLELDGMFVIEGGHAKSVGGFEDGVRVGVAEFEDGTGKTNVLVRVGDGEPVTGRIAVYIQEDGRTREYLLDVTRW